MSWVTDVLLVFNLGELYDDQDEPLEEVFPLNNINAWLQKHRKGTLDNLNEHVSSGGKAMQACVYGGAFNFLKIDEFIEVVKLQPWKEPQNVQLLIHDEEDERFTLYTLS
ncbi:hypothetical protein [Scytonema sp. NUACC26]|uniref:hypothetical protein n=1 Tax=Scytonema sp. NUACC26 TaxID=3140176 RepID=UPI0034DBB65F